MWTQVLRVVNGVLNIGGARVTHAAPGVATDDLATLGQVKGRTPKITLSPTPPPGPHEVNDLWVPTE